MARYIFLKEGNGDKRLRYGPEVGIASVIERFPNIQAKHIGTDEGALVIPSDRQDLTPFRDPRCVLLEVEQHELRGPFDKPGFWFLKDLSPRDIGTDMR
jgi:hypothetical protein